MPPGEAGDQNDTPGVPDESSTAEEHTTSAGIEPAETTVAEPSTVAASTTAEESATAEAADSPAEKPGDEPVGDVVGEVADAQPAREKRRIQWARVFAYGILPGIALILAMAAGYLKWQDNSVRDAQRARAEATQTAKDSTIKMLSYKPETVDKDLNGARDLLTGDFRDQYTGLINDVVIPGAQQKKISAVATVPAVGDVSADPNKAVVLLFVNQQVVVGQDAPTSTASSVRVTLEKVGDRWLISKFDPV
jgi:Mce-associated membrane protein